MIQFLLFLVVIYLVGFFFGKRQKRKITGAEFHQLGRKINARDPRRIGDTYHTLKVTLEELKNL